MVAEHPDQSEQADVTHTSPRFHGSSDLAKRGVVLATAFFDMMGAGIALPILPLLKEAFEASAFSLSLLVVMFPAAQIVMSPILGAWSDRIGRYRIIQATLLGTSLCHIAFIFLPSLGLLILLRAIAGGFAGGIAVARAYLLDNIPEEEGPAAMGRFGMAASIGFVAGLALSGLVLSDSAEAFDYTKPFVLSGTLGVLLAIVAVVLLRGEDKAPSHDVDAPSPKDLIVGGLAKLTASGIAYLGACILAAALFGLLFFSFPLLTSALYEWSPRSTAAAFVLFTLYIAFVQGVLVGPASRAMEWTALVGATFALFAAGFAIQLGAPYHWLVAIAAALGVTTANSLAQPMLAMLVIRETPGDAQGQSLGWVQSATGIGAIVGPVAGGVGLDHIGLEGPAFIAIFLSFVGLALLAASHAASRRKTLT